MKKLIIIISLLIFSGCEDITIKKGYVAGYSKEVEIGEEIYIRGEEILYIIKDGEYYSKENEKLLNKNNIVDNKQEVILEKEMFVRTKNILYDSEGKILSIINKGELLEVVGYENIEHGEVDKYLVNYKDKTGYFYSKYLTLNKSDSLEKYDPLMIHEKRGNTLMGGSADNLDFFPREKPNFEDNQMPEEARTIYINASKVSSIDEYIDFALENNINALVIDIKDNQMPGYKSEVSKKHSKTNYERAFLSIEDYQRQIKKAKDNGLYLIGRITVFKDSYYIEDNKDNAINDKRTGEPLLHNNSKWPSAFITDVWEYNVELALEAIKLMEFDEIQFDYIRFPDRISSLEKEELIDFRNKYNLEKAEAIQLFLMYATDKIHETKTYVSADVFGESAHPYVTAYGQYFPAISNIVDVISPMPYPDHFSKYEYDLDFVVWEKPYELLSHWGKYVVQRQKEVSTPAKVRSWIQAYDASRSPSVKYDDVKLCEQIKALYENNMEHGYMTWNSSSSIDRYESYAKCFKGEI